MRSFQRAALQRELTTLPVSVSSGQRVVRHAMGVGASAPTWRTPRDSRRAWACTRARCALLCVHGAAPQPQLL
jgi:hypothetical protein